MKKEKGICGLDQEVGLVPVMKDSHFFFAGTGVARPNSLLKVSMEMRGINEAITESYTLLFTSLKLGT